MSNINGKNIIMGLQHTFVMFGSTVLVPLITGLSIGVTLFTAGYRSKHNSHRAHPCASGDTECQWNERTPDAEMIGKAGCWGIAIVTIVEHFCDILAIGNIVEKDFLSDPGIHRPLLGDGLATSIAAMIGGPANTTCSENIGAVALRSTK